MTKTEYDIGDNAIHSMSECVKQLRSDRATAHASLLEVAIVGVRHLAHKARQYDTVVDRLNVADRGMFRADTLDSALTALRQGAKLRELGELVLRLETDEGLDSEGLASLQRLFKNAINGRVT